MIWILLLSLFSIAHADAPLHWNHLSEINERHEFYGDNESIIKPKDSWQTLFSVGYTNIELKRLKDCVFFRVPGIDPGVLKIKTVSALEACDKFILSPGDKEWNEIRSLHFSTSGDKISIEMTFPKYKTEKWAVEVQNKFVKPEPKMFMSSVELKSPKLIMLAPKNTAVQTSKVQKLKVNTICHNINEDCTELSPSICSQCDEGYYEIQNGCAVAPKYCGREECGGKDKPACRRGFKWQRKELENLDCRVDSSFAYCSKGLSVVCQGHQAFCR